MISGTKHFIVSKKIVWMTFLVALGLFLGMFIATNIRSRQIHDHLKSKSVQVKLTNKELKDGKEEYQAIFMELRKHLEEWKVGHDLSPQDHENRVSSFRDQAGQLMEGLSDMQVLLEEKEFQLWEKEGLLEYQEERLMNSEDLELEMASYINELAQILKKEKQPLPEGLDKKPYFQEEGEEQERSSFEVRRKILSHP